MLSANKSAVEHSVSVCTSTLKLQNENAQEGLAQFLGTNVETMQALIPFSAGKADLTEYLEALLTPIPPEGSVPSAVPDLIAILARALLLMGKLDLTPIEIAAVIEDPTDFGILDTSRPSVHDVEALWTFKVLTAAFHDGTNRLLAYYAMPSITEPEKAAKLASLASLSGWPPAQIDTLVDRFWPASDGYSTTQGVARMKAVFDTAAQSGLDVQSLIFLYGFATLPAVVNGSVDFGQLGDLSIGLGRDLERPRRQMDRARSHRSAQGGGGQGGRAEARRSARLRGLPDPQGRAEHHRPDRPLPISADRRGDDELRLRSPSSPRATPRCSSIFSAPG